jgi:hypothetical protein
MSLDFGLDLDSDSQGHKNSDFPQKTVLLLKDPILHSPQSPIPTKPDVPASLSGRDYVDVDRI